MMEVCKMSEKRRYKLELCYDGGGFHGWQVQHDLPTVQGTVEYALRKFLGHETHLLGSGRTDAGVHALKQVATFSTTVRRDPATIIRALNGMLPETVRILRCEEVPLDFHPIRDVTAKRYRYLVDDSRPPLPFLRHYCWTYRKPLDAAAMHEAARNLLGTHDFACFQSTGSPRESTVRTISDIFVTRTRDLGPWNTASGNMIDDISGGTHDFPGRSLVVLEVEANGFLYNMVRAIAGTLVLLGSGQGRGAEFSLREILVSKDRARAGPTAPPQGLYMLDVRYGP